MMWSSAIHRFEVTAAVHILDCRPFGQGHIHESYQVITDRGDFFLQRINTRIFDRPVPLMRQLVRVTRQLQRYYADAGLPYRSLQVRLSVTGEPWVISEGSYWRLFDFVYGSPTASAIPGQIDLGLAAHAFSHFIAGLSGLETTEAYYPIMGFHDLDMRFGQLQDAIRLNEATAHDVADEIADCRSVVRELAPVVHLIQTGQLPLRWVHNDTKIDNLIFDASGHPLCVADLDTTMPGTILYDVGDLLRTLCPDRAEDSPDLRDMQLDTTRRDQIIDAFVEASANWITDLEATWLKHSGTLMAALMGTRFLTDYIRGNVYYKIKYPRHNLIRARNQLHLARLFLAHA